MDATQDILQINWAGLKSRLHKQWGKITDDDLDQINGNSEELIRVLRKRYGFGKAQAEIEINRWLINQGDHISKPGRT